MLAPCSSYTSLVSWWLLTSPASLQMLVAMLLPHCFVGREPGKTVAEGIRFGVALIFSPRSQWCCHRLWDQ